MSPFAAEDLREAELLGARPGRREREDLLAEFVTRYSNRLRAMVALRLHDRLRARIGPSDVIQEVFVEASRRLDRYLEDPALPPYLWLRRVAADKLRDLHRHHLGAKARDARREVRHPGAGSGGGVSSIAMAERLSWEGPSPSDVADRAERHELLAEALESMDPVDREVLALRHFEQLSDAEVARVLGIGKEAARKRHFRALAKLARIVGRNREGRTK